jgi:hypothetical protein
MGRIGKSYLSPSKCVYSARPRACLSLANPFSGGLEELLFRFLYPFHFFGFLMVLLVFPVVIF